MAEPEKITIEYGDGAAHRAFTMRRPTHAELPIGRVAQLAGVLLRKVQDVQRLEEVPEEGVAEKVAAALEVLDDAAKALRKRLVSCLTACGAPEEAAHLSATPEILDLHEATMAIHAALAPPALVPK